MVPRRARRDVERVNPRSTDLDFIPLKPNATFRLRVEANGSQLGLKYRCSMLRQSRLLLSIGAITLAGGLAAAQSSDRAAVLRAQIDRIFLTREYDAPRFGPARWLPDGTAYAIVERPS